MECKRKRRVAKKNDFHHQSSNDDKDDNRKVFNTDQHIKDVRQHYLKCITTLCENLVPNWQLNNALNSLPIQIVNKTQEIACYDQTIQTIAGLFHFYLFNKHRVFYKPKLTTSEDDSKPLSSTQSSQLVNTDLACFLSISSGNRISKNNNTITIK